MSKVFKLPKGGAAPPAGPGKGLRGKVAALPKGDDFLSLTDFWQRTSGAEPGQPSGATRLGAPAIRDERELARQQAEEVVKQAQAEAGRIEQEAYDKGFAEGRVAGQQEFEAKIRQFAALLDILQNQRAEVLNRYEQELLCLINTMVDRLVHHEASVNPLVIRACFREAMEFVVENSLVKVHLHGDDLHRIKEISLEDPGFLAGKSRVQLIEDPAISPGGCLLQTSFGEIDATLESCKAKLYAAVDQAFLAALAADAADGHEPSPNHPA